MTFEGSPYEWRAPKRKWWFWPLIFVRAIWLMSFTVILLPFFLFLRWTQRWVGLSGLEFGILRLWGRLSWLSFSVKPLLHGTPMKGQGAVVSNHASWLDIPLLFGTMGCYMVAKTEVSRYPIIGFFARVLGTVFVDRKRSTSQKQTQDLLGRLQQGDRMAFFPEGTSTDALRVLNFRSTLFAAMVEANPEGFVQPVSIIYHAPKEASSNFFGWWGDMEHLPHMLAVMGLGQRAKVDLVFHNPIKIGTDRKALSAACYEMVDAGFKEFADKIEVS